MHRWGALSSLSICTFFTPTFILFISTLQSFLPQNGTCKAILPVKITFHSFELFLLLCVQSFLGFRQSADIDIILDGAENRKMAEIKTEEGKKERYYLYYDGETVSGKVS